MPFTYIRVLKYEAIQSAVKPDCVDVTIAVTLTSDLGDITYPHAIELDCSFHSGTTARAHVAFSWTGRQAVQKHRFQVAALPTASASYECHILPAECATVVNPLPPHCVTQFIVGCDTRLVVPVYFTHTLGTAFDFMVHRRCRMGSNERGLVKICEGTRESIVAHIWDAGLLLSCFLSTLTTTSATTASVQSSPLQGLRGLLRPGARVVELGSGVGILGLTISHFPGLDITLTDLSTARTVVELNMPTKRSSAVTFQELDWTTPGRLHTADVLVMSDVTYNETYHAALLDTIRVLSHDSTKILFASKYRHSSERTFIHGLKEKFRVTFDGLYDGEHFNAKQGDARIGDVEVIVLEPR